MIILVSILSQQNTYATSKYDEGFYSSNDIIYYNPESSYSNCSSSPAGASESSSNETGSLSVDKNFSLGEEKGKRAANLIKKMMGDYNLKDYQAAGIVGNFMWESGGEHLPPDVNEDEGAGPPAFSGGYGWAQWTNGRQVSFIKFSIDNGYIADKKSHATDAANYAYLNYELSQSGEKKVMQSIRKTTTLEDAVITWEKEFERADPDKANNPERIKRGNKALNALKSGGSITDTRSSDSLDNTQGQSVCNTSDSGGINSTVASAHFENVTFPLQGGASVVENKNIFSNNTTNQGHPYTAYDIYAPADTKVIAFTDGVVTNVTNGSMGKSVSVYNQKTGLVVFYTHMSKTLTKEGDNLQPGDQIGILASVKDYPEIKIDHLHIDASKGRYRVACSRSGCSSSNKDLFIDIGPDLYQAYKAAGG